jgi:molecular chaperone GrpE
MNKDELNKDQDHLDESPADKEKEKHQDKPDEKMIHKKDKKKKTDREEQIAKEWQSRCDELNDKYLRLYSEFDNYRRRTQKEKTELSKTASEDIIITLLPVMDDMERALTATVKSSEGIEMIPKEGLQLIYQKFKGLLAQKGLEPINATGQVFDVDFHDAITDIPAPSDDLKGKVVDEVEKGYKLNGKVIRYSKVVVGK